MTPFGRLLELSKEKWEQVRRFKFNMNGFSSFKIMSDSPDLYPRWALLLKINISSSKDQNCCILH
jgi:hypothetical protein